MRTPASQRIGTGHDLTDRLLAIPEVSAQYGKLLKELAGTAFSKDRRLTSEELLIAARATFDAADRRKAGKLDEDGFADLLTAVFPAPKFGPPPPPKGQQ